MTTQEAYITQYREEFIPEFELRKSLLRNSVTTEHVMKGNRARFLISGGKGHKTVTRGPNGRIPGRAPNNNVVECILTEEHDVVEETEYDIFAAQGRQREIMQYSSIGVMNRRYDEQILDELGTTQRAVAGGATQDVFGLARSAKTILGNSKVPHDGNLCAVITPAYEANLLTTPAFTSADFVNMQPLDGADAKESGYGYYRWMGIMWIVHPELTGAGSNDERCFMYHKSAVGHACDSENMRIKLGVDDRDDFSWVRTSAFCGAKVLQNEGIVVMQHDGSNYAAINI